MNCYVLLCARTGGLQLKGSSRYHVCYATVVERLVHSWDKVLGSCLPFLELFTEYPTPLAHDSIIGLGWLGKDGIMFTDFLWDMTWTIFIIL